MKKKREFYLTDDGIAKLREELDDLIKNQRKAVANDLKEAKEQGDLSENASWDAAKDRQLFIEGRIAEIEHILKNSKVITKGASDIIDIGSTVKVELEDGEQIFEIVGSTEADPKSGRISNESPIGQALLGKKKGEQIEIEVPAGKKTYRIVEIN